MEQNLKPLNKLNTCEKQAWREVALKISERKKTNNEWQVFPFKTSAGVAFPSSAALPHLYKLAIYTHPHRHCGSLGIESKSYTACTYAHRFR